MSQLAQKVQTIFASIGVPLPESGMIAALSPIDASVLAKWEPHTPSQVNDIAQASHQRFIQWREVPAPTRGDLLRQYGDLIRKHKQALGELVSIEAGKIRSEGLGEIQEVIDICDFALGLARQVGGATMPSERPGHMLMEQWQPLGPTLVISAFNFPAAVWAWNAALALTCGNTMIWKPSEKAALTAMAMHGLMVQAIKANGWEPKGLSELVLGRGDIGAQLVANPLIKCVSATGSTRMGRAVGLACAEQFKRSILELGGNNAVIVCASASIDQALSSVVFGAAGTAGQRCTTTRRVFIHRSLYASFVEKIKSSYISLRVGNPLDDDTRVGPLFEPLSFDNMQAALVKARANGGKVFGGDRVNLPGLENAFYVRPALVEMSDQCGPMLEETFAPILYAMPFDTLEQAVQFNNAASHGLSSGLFTNDLRESGYFLSAAGSDCGIANINAGTSGAEIGGAFGGEKETGGGRESGSDAWKGYMRRSTHTLNYSNTAALAQGVQF